MSTAASGSTAPSAALPFSAVFAAVGEVEWLWPGWLPLGHLSALVAEAGTGKSALALWLAACAASALPTSDQPPRWPDGQALAYIPQAVSAPVLWCEAEGRWAGHSTRARELGLPIASLYSSVSPVQTFNIENRADMQRLDAQCVALHPQLIVIDSLAAASGGRENDAAMHRALIPLTFLASKHHCAILIIHHIRKDDNKNPRATVSLDDMRGSTAIGAACLSVLALDRPDRQDRENRRLSNIKNNFALEHPPIGFRWLSRVGPTGQKESVFEFGEAPEPRAAAPGRTAQQLETALLLALTSEWEVSDVVVSRVLAKAKTAKERAVRSAFHVLTKRGDAESQYIILRDTPPPVMHWRRAASGETAA